MRLPRPLLLALLGTLVLAALMLVRCHEDTDVLKFGPPLERSELAGLAPQARVQRVARELERRFELGGCNFKKLTPTARKVLLLQRYGTTIGTSAFVIPQGAPDTLLADLQEGFQDLGLPKQATLLDSAIGLDWKRRGDLRTKWLGEWNASRFHEALSAYLERNIDQVLAK